MCVICGNNVNLSHRVIKCTQTASDNINVTTALRAALFSLGAQPIQTNQLCWHINREIGQQEWHGGFKPTGAQLANIFFSQSQANVHNAGNVFIHPGWNLYCEHWSNLQTTAKQTLTGFCFPQFYSWGDESDDLSCLSNLSHHSRSSSGKVTTAVQ